MTHALKTEPPFYADVVSGNKNFDLRKDDRPFKIGDKLLLQEHKEGVYTGEEHLLNITYVLRDAPDMGLRKGFCVISFREPEN